MAEAVPLAPPGWSCFASSRCSLAQAGPSRSGLSASSHALRPLGAGLNRWNKYPEFPFQLHLHLIPLTLLLPLFSHQKIAV